MTMTIQHVWFANWNAIAFDCNIIIKVNFTGLRRNFENIYKKT